MGASVESLEEQRFLLALDFAGGATDVMSQPFRLLAETTAGQRDHIPDFLAVLDHRPEAGQPAAPAPGNAGP
jgi:hypothetical protein